MARFTSKLTIVLGLCVVLALTRAAGHAAVDTRPEVICNNGACYPRVFRPTTEFQEVLEGQEIPGGLHVQMDFETHKKFAKLMDPESINEKDATNSILVVDTDTPGTFKHQVGSDIDDFAQMPSPIDLQHPDGKSNSDFAQLEADSRRNLQTAFDSIPELAHLKEQQQDRQEQKNHPVVPTGQQSDLEIFTEQLEIIKTSTNNDVVLAALEELADLASDMDFGLRLSGGEGLLALVNHLHCNEKSPTECDDARLVRSKSAMVIGTAVQNHEKAQNTAFKANLHKFLLSRLENESDQQVLRRLVTAYGSLVRGGKNDFILDEDVLRLARTYDKSTDPTFKRKLVYIMSDFADPDMRFVSTSEDDTILTATEEVSEDGLNSTAGSMTVVEKINVDVGPWCETLQQERKIDENGEEHGDWEIILRAVDLLHTSYPETCILTNGSIRDEL
ncbi:nucleotide exchange factor sil1 [Entomortierella chlamydospora]|uniref:Nucleotide exchange factor sil1 n=1 Tax=Entomortierella chlamydospora TaxID=101097 RepID=A0A9P6N275_9FUNG|nr:nucleotide exchange factor sil1 [Entomortierella chlamydospora]KAG0022433.1 nucleotide exchange factor sil1 [Entomortierella chlamydospora]